MTRKTIEGYKIELEDKIKSLVSKRNEIVLELEKIQKELEVLVEQQLSLDETKTRIECLGCHAAGYTTGEDKKKHLCQLCGGKQYIWAILYKKPTVNEDRTASSS